MHAHKSRRFFSLKFMTSSFRLAHTSLSRRTEVHPHSSFRSNICKNTASPFLWKLLFLLEIGMPVCFGRAKQRSLWQSINYSESQYPLRESTCRLQLQFTCCRPYFIQLIFSTDAEIQAEAIFASRIKRHRGR